MKENRGITLIALVITIIVLLILAGVAISMLSGENGILKKAAEAKTNTEEAKKEEAATLTDYDIDSHFILNNSKYKCRNRFITGVTIGEVEIEEGKKELRTIDTVEDLQKALPDGYVVSTRVNEENGKDEKVDKDENLKTGMAITKGTEEVARVVVYGDIRCNGNLSSNNASTATWISRCVAGAAVFPEFQKRAMNVIHDEYLDKKDADCVANIAAGIIDEEIKKQSIYATIKTPIKIPDIDTINSLGICNKDEVEKIYDEENEMYYYKITLNKSYTYKELYEVIKTKLNDSSVRMYYGGEKKGKSDETSVAIGAEISIGIPLIVNNNTIPESSNIYLEVK